MTSENQTPEPSSPHHRTCGCKSKHHSPWAMVLVVVIISALAGALAGTLSGLAVVHHHHSHHQSIKHHFGQMHPGNPQWRQQGDKPGKPFGPHQKKYGPWHNAPGHNNGTGGFRAPDNLDPGIKPNYGPQPDIDPDIRTHVDPHPDINPRYHVDPLPDPDEAAIPRPVPQSPEGN